MAYTQTQAFYLGEVSSEQARCSCELDTVEQFIEVRIGQLPNLHYCCFHIVERLSIWIEFFIF